MRRDSSFPLARKMGETYMQIYLPPRRKWSVYSCCDTFDKGFTATLMKVCRPSIDITTYGDRLPVGHFTQTGKFFDAFMPSIVDGFSLGLYCT